MDFNDLDEARLLHAALSDVFVAQSGGRDSPDALARVDKLCDAASGALEDVECRVAIRGVKAYAKLFFSADGHVGIDAGSLAPIDYLRLRIHNCLSAWRGRLGAIEQERLRRQRLEFELRRQRRAEPAVLSSQNLAEASPARGVRVLVVEDNRDSAESLRRLLYHSGYEVAVAYTGQDGLRAARLMKPDVVLCDIGLPDTNGFVVAASLREDPQTSGMRLIAVTAYGQDEDRRRAREAGFDLHLVKPVDPDVLLRKVSSAESG
jgi:CheY-like chemotaxis protein